MKLIALLAATVMLFAQDRSSDEPVVPARDQVFDAPLGDELPEAFAAINARLAEAEVIRARYSEEKILTVLRRPLRSEGRLVFCTGRGVHRVMTKPFEKEWFITPEGITQRHPDGTLEHLDLAALPVARAFVDAFLKIASGDVARLRDEFRVFFHGDIDAWTMGFVPRGEPMDAIIESMVLTGQGALLQSLVVVETNGDVTRTKFHDATVGPPLSPEEERDLFGRRG